MPITAFKPVNVDAEGRASTSNLITPLAPNNNKTMHVAGKIGKVICTWLIDTGADVTCVSSQLPGIKGAVMHSATSSPVTANGTHLKVLGELITTINIGHVIRPSVKVLVVDRLNSPAILGLDVLRCYDNMTIDWKTNILHLGGHCISLEERMLGAPRQPTEVCLLADKIIPARSQCFIVAGSKDFGLEPQDTLFTPYQEKMTRKNVLLGAGVVVRDIKNEIPILVMNNSEAPIKLYSGTSVGQLSTVMVEEDKETILKPNKSEETTPVNVNLSHTCLSNQQKLIVENILRDFRDVFANDETEVRQTNRIHFKIDTGNHLPVALKLRRTPFALRDEVDRQIRVMEERGVIRKSTSPWSSPILLVPKKDGTYRFCADFRALNDVTKTEIFPLPSIRECLDSLGNSSMFSTLDLHSGYWQIPIDPKDVQKTAFTTESGHWEFVVMPFGVKNAPAVFSCLMADVMGGLAWSGVAIYLDDIIIGGTTFEEHIRLLKDVLSRLREAGLTVKSSKVNLCQRSLHFLGHVVSIDGISPDPEKVETICNWPRPQNTKDVRSFLGLCNYYMEFVPNIQIIAKPLNELTGKAKFEWTAEREESFSQLKDALTKTPVLAFPDNSRPFELSTDASDTGFGCILSQRDTSGRERPIHYVSKTFSNNELSWHTRDKEAYALVYALRKFRHYLLGRKFTWHTDHLGLRWLRNTKDPRGRYARWVEEIEEFEFVTSYRAGRDNQHADALSRKPQQQCVTMVSPCVRFSNHDMRKKQEEDPVLSQVIKLFRVDQGKGKSRNPNVRRWLSKKENLFLDQEGILFIKYRKGRKSLNQLVVPDCLVPEVLQLKHDEAGHMSASKTKRLIQREYYWLSIDNDTERYCKTCALCSACKDPPRKTTTDSVCTSQPSEPWQEISMDLKGPIGSRPTTRGNHYLLVVLDLFTRSAEMIPIPDKTAKTVADAVVTQVFCRYGIPESILTDRGLEFDNSAMILLASELGIDKKRISPLHPQANGAVERLNRTIGQMLKKAQESNDSDWDLKIPFVRFNYLNQEHSSTGYSPFFLTYGRHPRTPVLIEESTMPKPKTQQQWATALAKTLKESYDRSTIQDSLHKKRRVESSKDISCEPKFRVNDKVLIYSPPKKGQAKALHKAWQGPYIVIQCRQGNTYRVKKADNFRQRLIRHQDQLRPFHTRPAHLSKQIESEDDAPHEDSLPNSNTAQTRSSFLTFEDWEDEAEESTDNTNIIPQENYQHEEDRDGPVEQIGSRRSQRQRRGPQRYGDWVDPDAVLPLYSDIVKRTTIRT